MVEYENADTTAALARHEAEASFAEEQKHDHHHGHAEHASRVRHHASKVTEHAHRLASHAATSPTGQSSPQAARFASELHLNEETARKVAAEVTKEVAKEVSEKLETKMKFFPGLTTVGQLLEWNETTGGPRVGPAKDLPPLTKGRRVLSMHDMAGGYQEIADNDYLQMFKSWDTVDLFVYFSHVRLSVPPVQWTATAHEHGRPALGSIILEANEPSHQAVKEIAQNKEQVLSQLVKLADHYGFDGWFFNNEGPSDETWGPGGPNGFVKELKTRMKDKIGERAQVIAYPYDARDSMFQAADGVMVNYNWPSDDKSMHSLAQVAGQDRAPDIYMGMDCFGDLRGNNVPDPKGVKACAKQDMSLGVFGPGYTFEKVAKKTFSLLAVDYDRRYWDSIAKNFGRQANGTGEWPVPFERGS